MVENHHYVPSQEHRFVVSSDEFSQARLRAVQRVTQDLHYVYPFIGGVTLFGSLSKGKHLTRERLRGADIDIGTFIDVDAFLASYQRVFSGRPQFWEWVDIFEHGQTSANEDIVLNLPPQTGLTARDEHALRAGVMIVDRWTQEGVRARMIGQPGHEFMAPADGFADNVCRLIAETGHFSLLDVALRLRYAVLQPHPSLELSANASTLAAAFSMDVGDTMGKYKKSFIRQLVELESEGEELWQLTRDTMIRKERDGEISPLLESQYPRSLAEAQRYYQ